jgi:riboflavin kinase/FMN adenylyltransferase
MKVHTDIERLPRFRNAVVTIGTFDGVHMGHRQIIKKLRDEARRISGESVIITFHPHPRKVISSAILGVRLINTLEEKTALLAGMGIDHLVVVPFTDAFANQPAEDYVRDFLVEKFHPHTVIIGYDHRFGRERMGDYRLLEKLAPLYNFQLKEIPKHILHEIAISSTNIREAILHHDIETANKLLGYEFFFEGEVVHGNKMGRQLGYPTANLKINHDEKIIPGDGIYAIYVEVRGQKPEVRGQKLEVGNPESEIKFQTLDINNPASNFRLPASVLKGMMSIGFRPTVDGKKRVIEVNIFDFERELYGQLLRVYVKKFLRAEAKFNSLAELAMQIGKDREESLKVL